MTAAPLGQLSTAFNKAPAGSPWRRQTRLSRQAPGSTELFFYRVKTTSLRSFPCKRSSTAPLFSSSGLLRTCGRGLAQARGCARAPRAPAAQDGASPLAPSAARQRRRRRGRRSPCRPGRCRCCSSTWAGRCSTSWTSASAPRASPGRRPAKVSGGRPEAPPGAGPGSFRSSGAPAARPCRAGASPCGPLPGLSAGGRVRGSVGGDAESPVPRRGGRPGPPLRAGAEQSAGKSLAMSGWPRGAGAAAPP